MERSEKERIEILNRLVDSEFHRCEFEGFDAVVVHVTADGVAPPSARARIESGPPQRWYPQENGDWIVRWPHRSNQPLPDETTVETKGWNHEHCSACNGHIGIGDVFWQSESVGDTYYWICEKCFDELLEIAG